MTDISILVVEDEAMTAMFLETIFKKHGYKSIKSVSSGENAVEVYLSEKQDVVLMDIRLAGKMNGIEAAEKIRSISGNSVNIIFMTGYSDSELRNRAMSVKPLAFFIKPLNIKEIFGIIESEYNLQPAGTGHDAK